MKWKSLRDAVEMAVFGEEFQILEKYDVIFALLISTPDTKNSKKGMLDL